MKLLLLLVFIPFTLFGSKIISYNIYDRTDRVDLMMTFDTPYTGIIKENTRNSKIIIKLTNAQIESSKVKQLSTRFLNSITLTPLGNNTQIVANVPDGVRFIASKTTDGYGLRLRFTNKPKSHKQLTNEKSSQIASTTTLPTKKDSPLTKEYYVVIIIMIVGIFILLYLQKKIKNNAKTPLNSLKKKNEFQTTNSKEVSIRFQKNIDDKNSVVMIDFAEQSYLVLMGEDNILLDKFTGDKPSTQEDFNKILHGRSQELDELLKVEKHSKKQFDSIKDEALQSYQQKAASLIYTEES